MRCRSRLLYVGVLFCAKKNHLSPPFIRARFLTVSSDLLLQRTCRLVSHPTLPSTPLYPPPPFYSSFFLLLRSAHPCCPLPSHPTIYLTALPTPSSLIFSHPLPFCIPPNRSFLLHNYSHHPSVRLKKTYYTSNGKLVRYTNGCWAPHDRRNAWQSSGFRGRVIPERWEEPRLFPQFIKRECRTGYETFRGAGAAGKSWDLHERVLRACRGRYVRSERTPPGGTTKLPASPCWRGFRSYGQAVGRERDGEFVLKGNQVQKSLRPPNPVACSRMRIGRSMW